MNDLKSENSISIIEILNDKDYCYIIMELCLLNLNEYMKIRNEGLSIEEIKEILIQLNKYLKNIKDNQLIKLDLKSILLSIDNLDKISFKFTKSITNNNNNISTNSPLNIEKNEIVENSNIWSLGLLIYYLLFKEYPFHNGYNQELKKTNDNRLNDLLNNMLQIDKNKRISWEKYLEHQFFKPTISENFTFFCSKHSEQIDNYCVNCKINICYLCTNQHLKHKIIPFSEIGFNHTEYENFNNLLNEIEDNISELSTLKKNMSKVFQDIKSINANSTIYDNDINNNYKQFYIDYLNAIKLKSKIEENIPILNLKNYIICNYNITKQNVNNSIQILNFIDEDTKKQYEIDLWAIGKKETYETNDNEIKKYCELYLNNKKIQFMTKRIFNEVGNYEIKIIIKKPLTNLQFLFHKCQFLTSLDLSNLNSFKVTNMRSLLNECSSLQSINLSNLSTKNVKSMKCLFRECSSLESLNLSNLDTDNLEDMSYLFSG